MPRSPDHSLFIMANNNNGNNNNGAKGTAPDLGSQLVEIMLQALMTADDTQRPERKAKEVNPWESVMLTPVQTDALQRLGWYQQGWRVSREKQSMKNPAKFTAGPRRLSRNTLLQHAPESRADVVRKYQFKALVCARLAQYGRVHIGDVAIVASVLGVDPEFIYSASDLTNTIRSALGGRSVTRTEDGFLVADTGSEKQALHDNFVQQWDTIMQQIKGASKTKATA